MNEKIIKRIFQYLDYQAIPPTRFEKEIGLSNGYLGKQMKKNADLGEGVIAKIVENWRHINIEWLITGKGEMLKKSNNDGDGLVKTETSNKLIPLVTTEALGGLSNGDFKIEEKDIQAQYVVPDFNGIDFMIRVKGSSMQPKYNSGDVVACRILREKTFIQWNKVHVVATNEQGILIKRLKKGSSENTVTAISDNKDYDPFEIPWSDITGIALVIGVIRLE